jgi:hypothetical protein
VRLAVVAIAALAFAFAWPMQVNGYNQTAHYALTKALADGVPYIDRTIHEVGDLASGDIATFEGHVYAVKAPGLAFLSLPAYEVVEEIGMRTTGDPTRAIWVLHLLGVVLPAVALVGLARALAERLQAGYGTVTAVTLGAATIVLPFATLFFSHVLSAALGFAAFVLAWWEREKAFDAVLAAGAGLAAGLAVTVEPQLIFVVAIVGVYSLRRTRLVARALAYAGGAVAGVLPLLAFNRWAFGSPFTTPYDEYWAETESNQSPWRVFGPHFGDLGNAWDFLFSAMGLVVLTPVVVAGVAGLVPMWRRGFRAEALALSAVVVFYVLYNTGTGGFGGLGPPRYLLTLVPFAVVPVALAFHLWPLATSALALVSGFQMTVMTATGPLAAYDGEWLRRAGDHEAVQTAASLVEITGWYTIVPFLAAIAVAAFAAVRATPWTQPSVEDAGLALAALAGWAVLALVASNPNGQPPGSAYVLGLAAVLAAGVGLTVLLGRGRGGMPGARPVRSL